MFYISPVISARSTYPDLLFEIRVSNEGRYGMRHVNSEISYAGGFHHLALRAHLLE